MKPDISTLHKPDILILLRHLVVRAHDASGKVIAASATIFAAPASLQINLTTATDGVVRTPSAFTTLLVQAMAQLKGTPLEDLKENKETHELRFLANSIGAPFKNVACLFMAHALGKQKALRDETLFGIFMGGIPPSLNAALTNLPDAGIDAAFLGQVFSGVLAHSRASLNQALSAAVKANVIQASYASAQDSELARLDALRVQAVQATPYLAGKTPLTDLLAAGTVTGAAQAAFAKAYADSGGHLATTWKTLGTEAKLPAGDVAQLKTTLQLGELLQGNLILVKDSLSRMAQKPGSSVRDLALLNAQDWAARITALDPQATSIPPVLPNETAQQRIARFATRLAERLAARYPTTAFAGALSNAQTSSFQNRAELVAFFNGNANFDLKFMNIDQYMTQNKIALKPDTAAELKTAQRLFRLSTNYAAVDSLNDAGYKSAQAVYFKGRAAFVAAMTTSLGSASAAQKTYAQAQMSYAAVLAAFGRYNLSLNGIGVAAMQSPAPEPSAIASLPDLQALFGSLDSFQCEDCQSVYSPAAYLVDLLQYLENFTASGSVSGVAVNTARDFLLQRRPDIQYIALDCNNTNITLPYIDVVNEILESAIAPLNPPVTYIDTLGTSAERRALPQATECFASPAAYNNTNSVVFPLSLPFDRPFAETRAYLAALGPGWDILLKLFVFPPTGAGNGEEAAIACVTLKINPAMQAVIDSQDKTDPWTRWGLPQYPQSVADPKNLPNNYSPNPSDWTATMAKVPVLLERSGLTLQQLYQLLEVVWVTHSGVTLQLGTDTEGGVQVVSPNADEMTFKGPTGLTGDVLDRANRFIRLWRAVGLQMWELDWALEHSTGSEQVLDDFLVFLSGAMAVQAKLQLPFQEALSFWMPIETRDVTSHLGAEDTLTPSTYSEVFRNPAVLAGGWGSVFGQLNPGSQPGSTVVESTSPQVTTTQRQSAIAAALGLSAEDISTILTYASAPDITHPLTLDTLNTLLRYQRLASALSLDVSDLILWMQLTASTAPARPD